MREKTSKKLTLLLIVTTLLGTMPLIMMPTIRAQPPAPSFYVLPATESFNASTTVGTQFTVTLWASTPAQSQNGLQTFTWSAELSFNATMLQCLSVTLTNGSTSQLFSGLLTTGLSKVIDNKAGTVTAGESLTSGESVGAMTASLVDIKFNITAAPASGQTLTCNIDPAYGANPSIDETYFLDALPSLAEETPLSTAFCTYAFSAGAVPPTIHDVVMSSVSAGSSVLQGVSLPVSASILNNGTVTETSVVVNATANGTLIGTQTVASIGAGSSQTLTFNWNTTSASLGTYTVTATVTPVANQTDFTQISKSITVQVLNATHPPVSFDLNGDGKVDMKDISLVALAFGSHGPDIPNPGSAASPNWNPKADVAGLENNAIVEVPDGKVDMNDIVEITLHFGEGFH